MTRRFIVSSVESQATVTTAAAAAAAAPIKGTADSGKQVCLAKVVTTQQGRSGSVVTQGLCLYVRRTWQVAPSERLYVSYDHLLGRTSTSGCELHKTRCLSE